MSGEVERETDPVAQPSTHHPFYVPGLGTFGLHYFQLNHSTRVRTNQSVGIVLLVKEGLFRRIKIFYAGNQKKNPPDTVAWTTDAETKIRGFAAAVRTDEQELMRTHDSQSTLLLYFPYRVAASAELLAKFNFETRTFSDEETSIDEEWFLRWLLRCPNPPRS